MTTKAAVNDFIAQKNIAVVGVSRGGKKFGNIAFKELKQKGYRVFPIHSHADTLEGEKCYPSLSALPEKMDGVLTKVTSVIVVPPAQTEQVVRDAHAVGIPRVWMQQGAESDAAIAFCREHGMSVVSGECILMFCEPARFYHRAHRWVKGVAGQLPR